MKVFEVLRKKKYLFIAFASTALFTFFYIYTQLLGNLRNIDLWLSIVPWYNAILFTILAVLFGMTLSFQTYIWSQPKTCSISKKAKGTGISSSASAAAFFVAQCPACASLGAIFLPATVAGTLTKFGWAINAVSIFALLFVINYLGGFRK